MNKYEEALKNITNLGKDWSTKMNKYEEAMDIIELSLDYDQLEEARSLLKRLIDKEEPKKPHLEGDGYANGELVYDTWVCPNCEKHYEVDFDKYDYCPNCGQHIDWSEYE